MFNFKKREHLIDALLKQDMTFKEKPLRMALVLHAHQIHHFHQHNAEHVNYDLFMLPFKGAFDKCHGLSFILFSCINFNNQHFYREIRRWKLVRTFR